MTMIPCSRIHLFLRYTAVVPKKIPTTRNLAAQPSRTSSNIREGNNIVHSTRRSWSSTIFDPLSYTTGYWRSDDERTETLKIAEIVNGDQPDAVRRAESVLAKMKHHNATEADSSKHFRLSRPYNMVIRACVDQPLEAERLFKEMLALDLEPDHRIHTSLLHVWGTSKHPRALDRCRELFSTMKVNEQVDEIAYTTMITAFAQRGMAAEAEALLLELLSDPDMTVDVNCFVSVINAYKQVGDKDSAEQAERLLRKLQEVGVTKPELKPSIIVYNTVMEAWARAGQLERGEELLLEMKRRSQGDESCRPDVSSYNSLINGWGKVGGEESLLKAKALVAEMEGISTKPGFESSKPNNATYTCLIGAYARSGRPDAGEKAEEIFHEMQARHAFGDLRVEPDFSTYSALMNAFYHQGTYDKVEDYMNEVLERIQYGHRIGRLNEVPFNITLDALSKTRIPVQEAIKKADFYLAKMQELHDRHGMDCKPVTFTYNRAMTIAGNGRSRASAEKAESYLRIMLEAFERGDKTLIPTFYSFNHAIIAWSKCNDKVAGERCQRILQQMKHFERNHPEAGIKPDEATYKYTIRCLGTCLDPFAAEALLQEMLDRYTDGDEGCKPDIRVFNEVIGAWARLRNKAAPERALNVLETMKKFSDANDLKIQPDTRTFQHLVANYAQSGHPSAWTKIETCLKENIAQYERTGKEEDLPSVVTFTTAIAALSSSRRSDKLKRAEEIFAKMESLASSSKSPVIRPNDRTYGAMIGLIGRLGLRNPEEKAEVYFQKMLLEHENGNVHCKPNTIVFNAFLRCFAVSQRNDSGHRAERMLRHMIGIPDCSPNTLSYTNVITAYGRSGARDGSIHAERLLDELKGRYAQGDHSCVPNTHVYGALFHTLAHQRQAPMGNLEKALRCMEEMKHFERQGVEGCAKNTHIYKALLKVLARSYDESKARRAWHIAMIEMEEEGVPLNVEVLDEVLLCCAFTSADREDAFQVAVKVLEKIHEDMKPSFLTYCNFFMAAEGLGKSREVEMAMELSRVNGFSGNVKLQEVYQSAMK